MSLRVLSPGPMSLVVDLGRPSRRSLGVPVGGAADRAALIQGNALVGNPSEAAALEFALAGPTLCAESDLGGVLFGAPFNATVNDRTVASGSTFNLKSGDVLQIGATTKGMRGYLCVRGGILSNQILDSRSAFSPVKKNEVLPCIASTVPLRSLVKPILNAAAANQTVTLRAILGPQADWFGVDQFFGQDYSVSPASNRMGVRLAGQAIIRPQRELVSEPVCPGTVQVVTVGQCIILGVDGQTIGGYPKIAQVISADLDALGQLHPGQMVTFQKVTTTEAEHAFRDRSTRLDEILLRCQTLK